MEILIVSVFFTLIVCTPITLISYAIKKFRKKDTSKQVKYLKRQGIAYVILLVVAVAFTNDENNSDELSSEIIQTITLTPVSTVSDEEEMNSIKEQAMKLDYKAVFRNPDEYVGKYFVVDVKILTVENGSWLSRYEKAYKSYTNDKYDNWFGDMVYLLDQRKETDYGYVKILEDDIVRVWGRFDGLVETKNAINGTKGEEMSLNVLYTELLSE